MYVDGLDDVEEYGNANKIWNSINRSCFREISGYLLKKESMSSKVNFLEYIYREQNIYSFLDAFEIGCLHLNGLDSKISMLERGAERSAGSAIEEINFRFEQHSVGFRFESGNVISVDSKFTHSEIVKPALNLLLNPVFKKANDEFMTAHRHLRSKEYKDCVNSANRAFETTLKIICDTKQWPYERGDAASRLVTIVRNNGLFTHDFDKNFDAFVAMLKSGLPSIRNDAGGHGEGLINAHVTEHIARFSLNIAASNITFILSAYLKKPT